MNSGVIRQYILGVVLLGMAVYLSINDSKWWMLAVVLGAILIILGNFNRKKNNEQHKK